MFYLLEDNRIIDSTNEKDISKLKWDYNCEFHNGEIYFYKPRNNYNCKEACGKRGSLCIGCKDAFKAKFNKIKKQSENIFDLIDWNEDLVRIDTSIGSLMIECKTAKSDFSDGYYDFEWIVAIYKPNEKGDYIKVWEKKDE